MKLQTVAEIAAAKGEGQQEMLRYQHTLIAEPRI
jgi:hypothetical protein